jgi:hypothetical protein
MKTTLWAALGVLLLPATIPGASVCAQGAEPAAPAEAQPAAPEKVLAGFQGIAWGDSLAKARSILGDRFKLDTKLSNDADLVYSDGQIGGRTVNLLLLIFGSEGFTKAGLFFKSSESRVISDYNDLKTTISAKYGKPTNDYRFFRAPYEEGDGYEIQAIRLGKGKFIAFWTFPVAGKKDNTLSLRITESLDVELTYENGSMMEAYVKSRKEKNAQEF